MQHLPSYLVRPMKIGLYVLYGVSGSKKDRTKNVRHRPAECQIIHRINSLPADRGGADRIDTDTQHLADRDSRKKGRSD